jgi:aryl-alcohol dehydrogenase
MWRPSLRRTEIALFVEGDNVSRTITAAVSFEGGKPFELRSVDLADLEPYEVRVKLAATGVCHADVIARHQFYPVPLPAVFGHEGAGVVEAIGSHVSSLEVGDHVVLGFNTCGACEMCGAGHPASCLHIASYSFAGKRPDGSSPLSIDGQAISGWFFGQSSFATHANVPERIAVKVPSDVPLNVLGPLGCGVMTGTGAVFNVLAPKPGSSFAVFGTGSVGFSGLLGAKIVGCTTIIAVDVAPAKLETAKRLGATHVVNSSETDPVQAIRDITAGRGVDYALDAVGVSQVFTQMADSLAKRGHGVLVGAAPPGQPAQLDIGVLLNSSTPKLTMVAEGDAAPQEFIPRLVRLYRAGLLPLDDIVTTFPFSDIELAFAALDQGEVIKPVVVFDD